MTDIAETARKRDIRTRWLLSAPAILIIFFAASGPLFIILLVSFLAPGPYGGVAWKFSTDAWLSVILERDIFDNTLSVADAHVSIILRSIKLAALSTLATLIFGFPTAYFIATRPPKTREIWLFLITIPFWVNLLIRTIAILEVIRNQGLINSVLIATGFIDQPIQMLYTDGAIFAGLAYTYLPFMVLPIYASLEKLDFKLAEAASDLYATPFQVLWRIILPLTKPGIIAGCILVFIPALAAYVTPTVLGGGKNLMIGNLIDLQFGQGRNVPLGSALSIALTVFVLLALLVIVRSSARKANG